ACEQCGATIPPQQGSARPRKFCTTCRPPRNRPNPRVIDLKASPEAPEAPQRPVSGLVASYQRQLEAVERLDTPEGAHVMHLAALFVSGNHTAAGAASLSKELRAAMEDAVKGAPKQADRLDELAARRVQKASGA
ncbi:hypothetical protein, partial [Amycolatopsis lurida]|uniref:hypothetical protein n=1 Tax=Amycolatopsis lurida TaxID=31959 RepID=UPI00365528DE